MVQAQVRSQGKSRLGAVALAALFALACSAGCHRGIVTSRLDLTVNVDSTLELDQVVVTVSGGGRQPTSKTLVPDGTTRSYSWQVVIANVAESFIATVSASGLKGGEEIVVFVADATIAINSQVAATLTLSDACRKAAVVCPTEQTCVSGTCRPRPVFVGNSNDASFGYDVATDATPGNDARIDQTQPVDGPKDRADTPITLDASADGGGGAGGNPDGGPQMGMPAALSINPSAKDFSSVVTSLSSDSSFQISNIGGQPSSVPAIALDGTDATMFSVSANGCMTAIAAGGSCLVTVRFTPTTPGAKSARLNVTATQGGAVGADLQGLGVAPGALKVSPTSQGFGSILQATAGTPLSFTITNTGGTGTGILATSIQGATEFSISTDGCNARVLAAGATCTIAVTFGPVSAGQKSGTLLVTASPGGTASSSLTGVSLAGASLGISPNSGAYATTVVWVTSATQTFTVTNTGGVAAGGVTAVSAAVGGINSGDFVASASSCTGTLAPGASCTVAVAFRPTASGVRGATLTATATPGGSASAPLSGSAVSAAAVKLAAATGSTTDFGTIVVGSTGSETFVVSNSGGQASSIVTIAASGAGFAISSPGAGDCVSGTTTLAPGGSCTVHVTLTSVTAGATTGMLTASATTGGSIALALTGTIATQGALSVSPMSSTFASLLPGTPGTATTFTVTNSGGSATGTLMVSITGSTEFTLTSDSCSAKTLAAGATCSVSALFKPASAGQKTGSLSVTAAPGGTASATLTGTGLAQAALSVAPVTGAFGNIVSGLTSPVVSFSVSNNGDVAAGTTTSLMPTLSGTNASEFAISSNTCLTTLGGHTSCAVGVVFKPTSAASNKTATMTVSATPGGAPTVALTGNGLAPASLHWSSASGSSTEFGSIVTNTSQNETFVVTNTGQQASTALTIALTGTDFSLIAPATTDCISLPATNATVLAPSATCTVRVRFQPTQVISRTGSLSVSATTGGSDALSLHGAGIAPSSLGVIPTSVNFGSVLRSGHSATVNVTVTNSGGVATGAIATSLPAGEFAIASDGCKGMALAPSNSCIIGLTFNPTTASATPKTAALGITANPGSSPSVALSGVGVNLSIDQSTFLFPATNVFAASASRSFTVSNPSSVSAGTTTALATVFTGVGQFDYNIDSTTCTGALGAGGLCNIVISFRPGGVGMRTATMTVSATPGGSVTAALNGQGQGPDGWQNCVTGADCQSTACEPYYPDNDQDTFGDPKHPLNVCGFVAPPGYVTDSRDCDDNNPSLGAFTSLCTTSSVRTYCLDDGIVRTQTCTGGGCLGSYCVGTVNIAGIFTCASGLQCTTAQGCSYTRGPSGGGTPPQCNLDAMSTGSLVTCDGPSDCGPLQVCCTQFNCGLTHRQQCFDGACPPSGICSPWGQVCDPLFPDCPAGTTCQGGTQGDITTGQGSWGCL